MFRTFAPWCFFESPRPSLLIKRAALGNLKASFHCTHWHRFFPLKKAFSKTYPSFLTLKEGSTFLTKPLFPQGREDVTAPPRRSEPLRSKVGGPSKVSPDCTGWDRLGMSGASKPSPYFAGWDRLAVAVGDLMLLQSPRHGCAGWDRLGKACWGRE